MLDDVDLDAVLIATPSRMHLRHGADRAGAGSARLLREAADLEPRRRLRSWPTSRADAGLVTQVGYHNRFVGSFREVKRLLDAGAIGAVSTSSARPTARWC